MSVVRSVGVNYATGKPDLLNQIMSFFYRNPHEALTASDVAVKFDVPEGSANNVLCSAHRDELLKRSRFNRRQAYEYTL